MVHIFDDACTSAQRARLAGWISELRKVEQLVPSPLGPHRFDRNIAELGWVHPDLLAIRAALVGRFGLGTFRSDPAFGDTVSFHEAGAFVQEHVEPFVEGERHVRLNVVVQHATAGGTPILDGRPLEVAPGQGWIFRPYKVVHAQAVVEGATPLITVSMGWSVSPDYRLPGEATRGHMTIVEELFDAIGRGDDGRIRRLVHPEVVVRFPGRSPFAGAHEGIDAVLALWARQRQFVADRPYVVKTVDVLEGQDHVAVLTRVQVTETDGWETVNLYRIDGGQIVEASPIVSGGEAFDRFWSQADQ